MKQNGKTEWEQHQEMRLKRELPKLKWVTRVINYDRKGDMEARIVTNFNSDNTDLDGIAHKIKLDLITNLLYGFEKPIMVQIRKVKWGDAFFFFAIFLSI